MRIALEAVTGAVAFVQKEWGDYGYSIEGIEQGPISGACTLHIVHADGSRFTVHCDRYGVPLTADGVRYSWSGRRWTQPRETVQ